MQDLNLHYQGVKAFSEIHIVCFWKWFRRSGVRGLRSLDQAGFQVHKGYLKILKCLALEDAGWKSEDQGLCES